MAAAPTWPGTEEDESGALRNLLWSSWGELLGVVAGAESRALLLRETGAGELSDQAYCSDRSVWP